MSVFALVSNDVVLSVGPYAQVSALASEQAREGNRVRLRRAAPDEKVPDTRGWAVEVSAADVTDLLHCLDQVDAQATLRQVRTHGIRARVVRV